jgi:hypothetical protein
MSPNALGSIPCTQTAQNCEEMKSGNVSNTRNPIVVYNDHDTLSTAMSVSQRSFVYRFAYIKSCLFIMAS